MKNRIEPLPKEEVDDTDERIVDAILAELERAENLHPPQPNKYGSIAVIREEYLEMEREIFFGDEDKAEREGIQLIVTVFRYLKNRRYEKEVIDETAYLESMENELKGESNV